jgi:hypothetical protein
VTFDHAILDEAQANGLAGRQGLSFDQGAPSPAMSGTR